MVVIGVVLVLLGLAGTVGLLDESRFKLYQDRQRKEPSAGGHRFLQRAGGVAMMVAGAVFVYIGLTDQ